MSGQASNTPKRSLNERFYWWITGLIPCGARWMLNGRWHWQRRFGAWWLQWWGWAFYYAKPWRPGSFDDR